MIRQTPSQRLDWFSLGLDYFGIFLEWIHTDSVTEGQARRQLKNAAESHKRALGCLDNVRP